MVFLEHVRVPGLLEHDKLSSDVFHLPEKSRFIGQPRFDLPGLSQNGKKLRLFHVPFLFPGVSVYVLGVIHNAKEGERRFGQLEDLLLAVDARGKALRYITLFRLP